MFQGLSNLSFIDMSENILSRISPSTFDTLPQLRILRLRGNHLTVSVLTRLNPLSTIEEFDVSENSLIGPLGPKTFPTMESLKDLQLSHNAFSSIKMGALQGLKNLTSLRLQHNQIDVIEDHAFSCLQLLVNLDIAHNRIVAVSGASLAHLNKLIDLDLRHNYLRALTADLIVPLKNLKTLRLDDNDISIVASDALKPRDVLKHFTLSDNPLNCDCSLSDFAIWLNNCTLSKEDKSTVICTTPPSLENGLLIDIPLENLMCGEDEQDAMMSPLSAPFKARISLKELSYDGSEIKLQWNILDESYPYTCDAIFVYEQEGANEVLIESTPLKCNSSEMQNPKILNVTVPDSVQLMDNHRYRYCVVLLESGQTDDVSLILGCSDVMPLVRNMNINKTNRTTISPKVISIQSNLSSHGILGVEVQVYPQTSCELNVVILEQSALLSQRKINCSDPKYNFVGLNEGPYRVCVNVINSGLPNKPRCLTVYKKEVKGFSHLDVAFTAVFLFLCLIVIALIWGVRKILFKPKLQTHQCFLPPECNDQGQHNRYVKLQATTKL